MAFTETGYVTHLRTSHLGRPRTRSLWLFWPPGPLRLENVAEPLGGRAQLELQPEAVSRGRRRGRLGDFQVQPCRIRTPEQRGALASRLVVTPAQHPTQAQRLFL